MKSRFGIARTMVGIAATVWFGISLFIAEPGWVFLPLWALFPGAASFWGPLPHVMLLYAWVLGAVVTFMGLALLALLRNNTLAAIGFIVLLLVSAYFGVWRAG